MASAAGSKGGIREREKKFKKNQKGGKNKMASLAGSKGGKITKEPKKCKKLSTERKDKDRKKKK